MRHFLNAGSAWWMLATSMVVLLGVTVVGIADAQPGHRGGGARAAAHANINRPVQPHPGGGGQNRSFDHNRTVDHTRNVNRDVNRNVNRDVHVDVDYHDDHWNHWDDHPVATAAAVTAGVALTTAVIGSMVYSLPPSCATTVINGMAYQQCGSTWYEPRYSGTTVQYVVINPPR